MLKKLYFVWTNGYSLIASVDEEKNVRILVENEDCEPFPTNPKDAEKFLINDIEDDSGWTDSISYTDFEHDFLNNNNQDVEIWAEVEKEI